MYPGGLNYAAQQTCGAPSTGVIIGGDGISRGTSDQDHTIAISVLEALLSTSR